MRTPIRRIRFRPTFWIAVHYLACGMGCLAFAQGEYALSPWAMAVPFGLGQFLSAGALSSVAFTEPSSVTDPPKHDQWNDDRRVDTASVSSARWAYMLLRQPVMVAVHADEMLAENRP